MPRLLIVSPHFPPINAPDMQRVRMSLPYYRAHGWEVTVLCVDPARVEAVQEPELAATLGSDFSLHRIAAWSKKWSRWLGIGTLGLRAWVPLYLAGRKLLQGSRFDLVFLSNTQFVTFAAARLWQQEFGVPYVVDWQDPWRTSHYKEKPTGLIPGGWKYRFAQLVGWALEEFVLSGASGMMAVSPRYIADLRQRYPWSKSLRSCMIAFGATERDLQARPRTARATYFNERDPALVHLVNTGAAGPIMPHALNALFEAVRDFRSHFPESAQRLRLHFIGTNYVPAGAGMERVMPVARSFGIADLVSEVPHRIGHLESIALQCEADGLLLLGSSDLAYSPSKLFPYFLSQRPMLGIVFADSQLQAILARVGGAFQAVIGPGSDPQRARAEVQRFFALALQRFPAAELPQRNESFFADNFLAEKLVQPQIELFEACLKSPAAVVCSVL